ncbi:MAG TPA: sulfatase-like hydrolase/transferase [Bryobacteraceae bacterium]|nr:sulfatase-like hydrolase/transferase [Bryobacteraceae bacterium]
MTRKTFLRLGGAALTPGLVGMPARGQSGRPKNVLLLMADQHRRDCLGVEGNPNAHTPSLDAVARSGVRFESAYCANPVCTPSRASLLTGLYTHHHQTWSNATPWPFEHKTAAHYFGRAGYMTALIGKMHFVDAQTHGFDYHLDFNDWFEQLGPKTKLYADELSRANSGSGMPQIDDLWRDAGDPWKGSRTSDGRKGAVAVGGASKIPEADHFESFVARETVRFLKEHGKQQPFFAIASCLKPHDPFMPAARFAAMFRAEDMKLPPTWGKVDLARAPQEVRKAIERDAPTPELSDPAQARRRIAMYYANLAQMDDAMGKVLAGLRDLDLEGDTVVIYTSDHGEMLGDHGLWNKFQFYEGSCGVPLMVRAPGITEPGSRCATPVSLVDVLPTMAEVCGVPAPAMDGKSLLPQLRNVREPRGEAVFAEFNLRTPHAKYMIRSGDFKYTLRVNDVDELYDLRSDAEEMHNLALEPGGRSRAERMRSDLLAWYRPPELKE